MTIQHLDQPGAGGSAEVDAAWSEYQRTVDDARTRLLSHERARDEADRSRASYAIMMLCATGFNMYVAPRQTHPNLYVHPIFMPYEVAWGQPCPDFLYRWAFLSGANTYRISGKRGTTRMTAIQLMDGFWGDETFSELCQIDLAKHTRPDGTFEFLVGVAQGRTQDTVAIPRGSKNIVFQCREAFWDWENDVGLKMQIETVALGEAPLWTFSEAELAGRIRKAGRWVAYNVNFAISRLDRVMTVAGGKNAFAVEWDGNPTLAFSGGYRDAMKGRMVYDIEPDEALVVELNTPGSLYWSLSVGDIWYQTPDYSYHQSSLNGQQTRRDADGKVRWVMSLDDPGVPNWVDLVGARQGLANLRNFVLDEGYEPKPIVRRVKLSDLRSILPADTPYVDRQARTACLARRARASLARYGY